MGMDIQQLTWKDGEIALDPAIVALPGYFGGQPAMLNVNGQATPALGASPTYIGMFKNSWSEDSKNGNVTIIPGGNKVIFFNGSNQIDSQDESGNIQEGAPYNTALTYANAEYLYIDPATALWTNVLNGTPKGIITKAPTATDGSLVAYMFMVQ